jgi:hypothetical protein
VVVGSAGCIYICVCPMALLSLHLHQIDSACLPHCFPVEPVHKGRQKDRALVRRFLRRIRSTGAHFFCSFYRRKMMCSSSFTRWAQIGVAGKGAKPRKTTKQKKKIRKACESLLPLLAAVLHCCPFSYYGKWTLDFLFWCGDTSWAG